MKLLRDKSFQELLVSYPRPQQVFYKAYEVEDEVRSTWMVRDADGNDYKPDDYLEAFVKFVKENEAKMEAIRILLDRPRGWNASSLTELRDPLKRSVQRFTAENLEKAHAAQYGKALVEIIVMVARGRRPCPALTAAERTERAFAQVTARKSFTDEQRGWLDRIRQVMIANLSIERDDFDYQDALSKAGGWGAARRVFGEGSSPPSLRTEWGNRRMSDIVTKLWGFCHTLRHEGIGYAFYVEQLTCMLFIKMAEEAAV